MKKLNLKNRQGQKGFTLVELAVVMIIVGLLIGGILKGQELITNAQVASSITQAKGIDAAVSTFRDSYRALPGDMQTPNARLPNCTAAPCTTAGNGDSRISNGGAVIAPGGAMAAGNEGANFFVHMASAELLSGVQPAANNVVFGEGLPETPVGGGYGVGFHAGGAALGTNTNATGGHYLSIRDVAAGPTAGLGPLTAAQAARMDAKMDDGDPTSGSVFPSSATSCVLTGAYDEANNPRGCNLFIKIQG